MCRHFSFELLGFLRQNEGIETIFYFQRFFFQPDFFFGEMIPNSTGAYFSSGWLRTPPTSFLDFIIIKVNYLTGSNWLFPKWWLIPIKVKNQLKQIQVFFVDSVDG